MVSSDLIRPNGPPTAVETIRIKRFISSRERDIANLTLGLDEEEKQIDVCKKAISNLELSIPQGKKALQAHQENLSAFIGVQSRFKEISSTESVTLELEDHSRGLHHEMKNCADAPISRTSNSVDEQVVIFGKEVRNLQDKVQALELELEGWKISHRLSTVALQHLRESREKLEEDMKRAQNILRPVPKVPSEVWVTIFEHCVNQELEDYVSEDVKNPLRSTAFVLSQVCRQWRQIVLQERNIWNVIAIHSSIDWSQNKYHFFTTLLSRSGPQITLVSNLSQTLAWRQENERYVGWVYINNQGSRVDGVKPNGKSEVTGNAYSLHLVVKNDSPDDIAKIHNIRFCQPYALTVSSLSSNCTGIFNKLTIFNTITSLTITHECSRLDPPFDVSAAFPNLQVLKFHIQQFPTDFPIASFLISTLKELHLQHNSNNELPSLSAEVQLPNLQSLGISFPGSGILSKIEAPLLERLLFYGPVEPTEVTLAAETDATTLFNHISHLRFEDWTNYESEVVPFFHKVWTKASQIQTLEFSNCYVHGESLISTIETSSLSAGDSPSRLTSIRLSRTTGITQSDCENMCGMGKTVIIYA